VIALVGSVLAASLLGSPHCAGMCGGFVCFYSAQGGSRALAHLAYNGGRLVSYAILGALAGAFGAGVDRMGAAAGVARGAAILAGLAMVLWGLATILGALGARIPQPPAAAFARGRLAAALRAVAGQPPALRGLVIGLLTTLLPCGFLYAFVATAAGTGSPSAGALVMAVFWAGTVPVMAGLGLVAQRALGPLQRRLPVVTAAALVVVGVLMVAGRLQPRAHAMHGTTPTGVQAPAAHGSTPAPMRAPAPPHGHH
jgi:hypothetical protein